MYHVGTFFLEVQLPCLNVECYRRFGFLSFFCSPSTFAVFFCLFGDFASEIWGRREKERKERLGGVRM